MKVEINEKGKSEISIIRVMIEFIIAIAILIAVFYLITLFNNNINSGYVDSVIIFIRVINSLMAIIAIVICFILYNKTNEQVIFSFLLVYVSVAVTIVTGEIDYLTFFNSEFVISNYVCITLAFF